VAEHCPHTPASVGGAAAEAGRITAAEGAVMVKGEFVHDQDEQKLDLDWLPLLPVGIDLLRECIVQGGAACLLGKVADQSWP
jgi:hypothetical protein